MPRFIFLLFLCFSCPKSNDDFIPKYDWNILCYIAADNNLHNNSFGSLLKFIHSSWNDEKINICFFCDGIDKESVDDTGLAGYYLLRDGNIDLLEPLGEVNSGSKDTFTQFIDYFTSRYEAKHTALILWGHSDDVPIYGDSNSFLTDNGNGMSFDDYISSINYAADKMRNKKLDVVISDSCRAMYAETALSIKADYFIAAQETQSGASLDYARIMEYLQNSYYVDPENFAMKCGKFYEEFYSEGIYRQYKARVVEKANDCISVLNLSGNLEDGPGEFFRSEFPNFCYLLKEALELENLSRKEIKKSLLKATVNGSGHISRDLYCGIDFPKFISLLSNHLNDLNEDKIGKLKESIEKIDKCLKNLIIFNYSRTNEILGGLSIRNVPPKKSILFYQGMRGSSLGPPKKYSLGMMDNEDLWVEIMEEIYK